ncbi:MAG: hypothetical protein ACI9W4_002568 [Rhodothermales bacterium]|jgi:hypothetical protein
MTPLVPDIVRRESLPQAEREAMFVLLERHYLKVTRPDFERDLNQKQWVILVREAESGTIRGFSTIEVFLFVHNRRRLRILYSGDTVIDRDYWGSLALPVGYASLVSALTDDEPIPTYWFLLSKGFRTYRILPVFFDSFFPRWNRPMPDSEAGLLGALGHYKFNDAFDSASGILRSGPEAQCLRPDLGLVSERRKNRDIEFFLRTNPGHAAGDELVCLADFSLDNLSPFMQRALSRSRVEVRL